MKNKHIIDEKSRSEWLTLIYEWVHSEEDRKILERYLLDGLTMEQVAEEFNLSTVSIHARLTKSKKQLFKHIK